MANGSGGLTWLCDVETGNAVSIYETSNTQDASQFYGYASQQYNGPDAEDNTILIRWHRNTVTNELSLIFVAKNPDAASNGPINISITNLNSSAYVSVSDDAGVASKIGNDVFASLAWSNSQTNGFAISSIDVAAIPNMIITFDNPYDTMYLKFQTFPNQFAYIRQDKLETFSFRSSNYNPCVRFVYPDGQAFIVNTPTELSDATGSAATPPTPSDIFDEWGRFAGLDWYPTGTTPAGEATSWVYDAGNDVIRSTVNSTNYIGFISPETLAYYNITVLVGSTNADDDLIGVVIAFVMDGSVPTSICAVRSNNGSIGGKTWALIQLAGNTVTVLVDGSATAPSAYPNNTTNQLGGWGASGPTTIKVKRDNRTITLSCSQFTGGTGEPLDPTTTLTYSIPVGSIFDGACSYGYVCQSQNEAYFNTLDFTGGLDQNTVYDLNTIPPQVYEYNGTAWIVNPNRDVFEELGQPRTVSNPSTGKTYYLDNNTVTIVP